MKEDMSLPVSLYQSLTDDMVTNLSLGSFGLSGNGGDGYAFYCRRHCFFEGEPKKGSVYDEVYVDDDALYDLIIQTFYTEEQSEGESK